MLVLTRCKNQRILFPNLKISVEVVAVSGKKVRLGVDAPNDVRIVRDELKCFDGPRSVSCPASRISGNEQALRQLDAANLAIHLARNQLQQGLTELAQDALEQALTCLQSLDQMIDPNSLSEPNGTIAVHESRVCYQKRSTPVGLLLEGDGRQRDRVTNHIRDLGLCIIGSNDSRVAICRFLAGDHAEFALMICDHPFLLNQSFDEAIGVGGGLKLHTEMIEVAGQHLVAWTRADFSLSGLLA